MSIVDNRKSVGQDLKGGQVVLILDQKTVLIKIQDDETRNFLNLMSGKYFPYSLSEISEIRDVALFENVPECFAYLMKPAVAK